MQETLAPVRGPPAGPQVFYLELAGASGVDYDGPITVHGIDVPAFVAPQRFAGQEATIAAALAAAVQLRARRAGDRDARPARRRHRRTRRSTSAAPAARSPTTARYYGLSEQVDRGNRDRDDNAFVFTGDAAERWRRRRRLRSSCWRATSRHELGHLLGFEHAHAARVATRATCSARSRSSRTRTSRSPRTSGVDILEDGMLDIRGDGPTARRSARVRRPPADPRGAARLPGALLRRRGRPRRLPGHHVRPAHDPPGRHRHVAGARVRHGVGGAGASPPYTESEKLQILAFAYGYATHARGRRLRPHARQRVHRGRVPRGRGHRRRHRATAPRASPTPSAT